MARRTGLGKGLSALIPAEAGFAGVAGEEDDDGAPALLELPVTAVVPNRHQPRTVFDEESLTSLTASVRELGVLQPVLVRPAEEGTYELIAGERRWRAARRAGLDRIPALVRRADDLASLAGHCTLQEDNAAKVERQVRKSAAALLLMTRIGMRADAIVTGASEKGTWVRIAKPMVEGKLVRGEEGLDVGDRLRVQLVHVDVIRGFIDFARVNGGRGQ